MLKQASELPEEPTSHQLFVDTGGCFCRAYPFPVIVPGVPKMQTDRAALGGYKQMVSSASSDAGGLTGKTLIRVHAIM